MKSRLDHLKTTRNALLTLFLWTAPAAAQAPVPATPPAPLELRLADVGRFAVFVDLTSVQWSGRTARLRLLQVTEGGFRAGADDYWGGWRHEVIDCEARTIRHAGFASIRAGGHEGPLTGDLGPAVSTPQGSADEAAARVVCDGWKPFAGVPVATGVEQAVRIARPLIETGAEP
ncbi:hypothetical protein [Caulobacter sp. HMWF009]|uniref:hypothetical protein n=1 Tax=Caulobacter sp. HMWF009 TaxID=2056846 RepID=UPI000D37ACF3|nr:hypothetical protein [Caulobacter sp. HMWF009]PTS88849.1 hypothetical protein DBR21_08270 [Caulobacter sp. HMWF009]